MKERSPAPEQQSADRSLQRRQESGSSRVLDLQRSAGNHATAGLVSGADHTGPVGVQRVEETIGTETVEVSFFNRKKEKAEAAAIIKEIKDTYGISLDSQATIDGIKDQYTNVPKKVTDSLEKRKWRLKELRSLKRALAFYAPILGAERAKSTRAGSDQEVTSVGKVKNAIDTNQKTGQLDTTTLGEYFRAKKNMGLFKASEGYTSDFKDEGDQLTGTFVHEIAHGLLEYSLADYIKETGGYWTDRNTASGKKGAEAPITDYGAKNAAEDLCESAMMYFVAPNRLKNGDGATAGKPGNACPLRYAFMVKLGKDWIPPPPKTPIVQEDKPPESPPTAPPTETGSSVPPGELKNPFVDDTAPGPEGEEFDVQELISGPDTEVPETGPKHESGPTAPPTETPTSVA